MKGLGAVLLLLAVSASVSMAQSAQRPATSSAGYTDLYHVHFNKAAIGQASALADVLKTQDPKAPMPGHFVVLRHQEGDDWDYCVIEHLGTKATIDAATATGPSTLRNLSEWHTDTFAAGPAWADFARAMGLGAAGGKGVYAVAIWRAAPGHRDQLEQALKQQPPSKVPIGHALLMHLEGGAWQYLAIDHYNSWQDFAADEAATTPQTGTGKDPWSQIREHSNYHTDTLTDRIAPK
jgi:hypothetical protein